MTEKLIYDIFGYFSILFAVVAFLSTNTKSMRVNGVISSALFTISIWFYNGINGVFVSLISILIKVASFYLSEKMIKIAQILSLPISLIFFFFINPNGWIGIFPAIAIIFIILADTQKDLIKMKQFYYGSATAWLLYGIALGSIPAILYDIFGIAALTYSIYKEKSKLKECKLK